MPPQTKADKGKTRDDKARYEEEPEAALPVGHPQAGYTSPDLSFHEGRGQIPDEEREWHEARNQEQQEEEEAVEEHEEKVAKEEQEERDRAFEERDKEQKKKLSEGDKQPQSASLKTT